MRKIFQSKKNLGKSASCTPHANLLKTFYLSDEIDSDLVETLIVSGNLYTFLMF